MNVFFAPHNDDEALFGSYIIQLYKPLVVVVTDSYIQHERGDKGCSAAERRAETEAAMRILGAEVEFLHIPDKDFNETLFRTAVCAWVGKHQPIGVFAPAIEGGNWMHDVVGQVCDSLWNPVRHYYTYTKEREYPLGPVKIEPTEEMRRKKLEALRCYTSQWQNVCRQYFTTPHKDEYINA